MGIVVYSSLWVMQDLYRQPCLVIMFLESGFSSQSMRKHISGSGVEGGACKTLLRLGRQWSELWWTSAENGKT